MKKAISIILTAIISIMISAITMHFYMPKYSSEIKEYEVLKDYSDYIANMSLIVDSEKTNLDLKKIYKEFPDLECTIFQNSEKNYSGNQSSIVVIMKSSKNDLQLESEYPVKIDGQKVVVGNDFCIRNYSHAKKNRFIVILAIIIFIVIRGLIWIINKIKKN